MQNRPYAKTCVAVTLARELVAAGLPQDPGAGARFYGASTYGATTIVHVYDDLTATEGGIVDAVVTAHVATPLAIYKGSFDEVALKDQTTGIVRKLRLNNGQLEIL